MYLALALALGAMVSGAPVLAKEQQQHAFNFVGAYKQAQEKRTEADKKLYGNMKIVASFLADFRDQSGHLPEPGFEQDEAVEKLQRLMKPNPYSVTGLQSKSEQTLCKLRFVSEYALDDARRKEWQVKAPPDWTAEPGTITAVMSHSSYFIVWGAGADHAPIMSTKTRGSMMWWCNFEHNDSE